MNYVIIILLIFSGVLIGNNIKNTNTGIFLKKYRGIFISLLALIILVLQYNLYGINSLILPYAILLVVGIIYIVHDFM